MRTSLLRSCLAVAAGIGLVVTNAPQPGHAAAQVCVTVPHSCGFPDATNTGVPAGVTLKTVPSQVSGGPGWRYNYLTHEVDVTGYDTTLKGLNIPYDLNITASKVTIIDDRIVHSGYFGISLRHTSDVTIEHSTISGANFSTGRLGSAIDDLYNDSTKLVIAYNNIFAAKTAVQVSAGLITTNYIHNFGYVAGDHLNGILDVGTTQPLTIFHNTILNNRSQTDAISINASEAGTTVAHKTIEYNLLAGGSFTVYGGSARGNSTSGIVIEDNRFSQAYYPKGGRYGPIAYFASSGAGNAWSGNIWDATGQPLLAPLSG
jgi:hypothetical protein